MSNDGEFDLRKEMSCQLLGLREQFERCEDKIKVNVNSSCMIHGHDPES